MVFSKSFGYAVRGILYIAATGSSTRKIHLDEMAKELSVPKHFLGKIMRNMSSQGIISSDRGTNGGFYINSTTLQVSLKKLVEATGERDEPDSCVLRLRKCNGVNPCPLHNDIESLRCAWNHLLSTTTLENLLSKDHSSFIKSIALEQEA